MTGRAGFVAHPGGIAERIIEARERPPQEQPRRVPKRYTEGDWVAPLPGRGNDYPAGRVERVTDCAGLDNDQVVMVQAGGTGMPYMLKASELYPVQPPKPRTRTAG